MFYYNDLNSKICVTIKRCQRKMRRKLRYFFKHIFKYKFYLLKNIFIMYKQNKLITLNISFNVDDKKKIKIEFRRRYNLMLIIFFVSEYRIHHMKINFICLNRI